MDEPSLKGLIELVQKYGDRKPKKLGSWFKLTIKDNLFLVVDSWIDSIALWQGSGYFDFHDGFSGYVVEYYGSPGYEDEDYSPQTVNDLSQMIMNKYANKKTTGCKSQVEHPKKRSSIKSSYRTFKGFTDVSELF